MARTVGIGIQSFEKLIMENSFYIDKTDFIRQWWENRDEYGSVLRKGRCLSCARSLRRGDIGKRQFNRVHGILSIGLFFMALKCMLVITGILY